MANIKKETGQTKDKIDGGEEKKDFKTRFFDKRRTPLMSKERAKKLFTRGLLFIPFLAIFDYFYRMVFATNQVLRIIFAILVILCVLGLLVGLVGAYYLLKHWANKLD